MAPRVLIVADNVSASFGGEAILPLHYFRQLRRREIEAWMIAHARTRTELESLLPDDHERLFFVPDTSAHRALFSISKGLPRWIREHGFSFAMGMLTQAIACRMAREIVTRHRIDVVHQPVPVSPKRCSLLYDLGAPVVMGPMNGGMMYPSGFREYESRSQRYIMRMGRSGAHVMNRLVPGKLRASTLLVANERTRRALPSGCRGRVVELVENGVDLALWEPSARPRKDDDTTRFAFSGRLVDWKAVDILIEAFAHVCAHTKATLDIIGDGAERPKLESLAGRLNVAHAVRFHGWLLQPAAAHELATADVFVLPSLYECGGAVVLEAMALGIPVISTAWGGPKDYLDESCGVLVEPRSRAEFVENLSRAMIDLAARPELRKALGRAARTRVVQRFDWNKKIDTILKVYADTIGI
jgi:glycosyltransferase involved in cell wall biosynthesis